MRVMHPRGAAAANWWDPTGAGLCIWCAYQPKGAASFAASLLDLSGNGNNASDPGGANTPGWDAVTGWAFNNDYLMTTFVPQNDQSQSMMVQYTGVANNGYLAGSNSGGNIEFNVWPVTGFATMNMSNGNSGGAAPGMAAGNITVAGNRGYRNGADEGYAIGAYGGATTNATSIGARYWGGGVSDRIVANIQAFAIYSCTLTAPQVAAVAAAMAAL